MKFLYLILANLLLLSACKSSKTTQENTKKNNATVELSAVPIYKDIQFFVAKYPHRKNGAYMTPNLRLDDLLDSTWSVSLTPSNDSSKKYDLKAKYLGSTSVSDKYEIDLHYTSDKGMQKAQYSVDYIGKEIVIFNHKPTDKYAVGIRPKPTKEQ